MSFDIQFCLIVIGTAISVEGAIIIAFSQVFETVQNIIDRNLTVCGFNGGAVKAAIEQKLKSGYGLVLTVFGAIIQISSAFLIPEQWLKWDIWVLIIVVLVSCGVLYVIDITFLKKKIQRVQEQAIQEGHKKVS